MAKRIKLSGEVGWEITAKKLESQLPKNGKHAILEIDSFGGSVFEGNRLFNTIKDHLNKFPDSISIELGVVAASAASFFPLAVDPKNISVRDNTVFMIHKAWTIALGNSDEMQLQANILDGFDRMLAKIYSGVTKKSIDDTLIDMKNEVWLMGGQSILDAGFASKIIESSDEEKGENNDTLEKNEISAKIEEIKNKLKDVDNKEDLKKWSAKLDIENKKESNPPEGDGNIKKEDISDMNFTEYLNSNPEHKAEYDLAVKNAVDAGIKADRERGKEILNLSGMKLSEEILNAFNDGSTVGDYATAELKRVNEAKSKTPDTILGSLSTDKQIPESTEVENSLKTAEEKDREAVNAYLKKGGK